MDGSWKRWRCTPDRRQFRCYRDLTSKATPADAEERRQDTALPDGPETGGSIARSSSIGWRARHPLGSGT